MHVSPFSQKNKPQTKKKEYHVFCSFICCIYLFLDSNDTNTASNSTLNVPGSSKRSNSPNSTISTLTTIATAPLLTADNRSLNNSTKTDTGKSKYLKKI